MLKISSIIFQMQQSDFYPHPVTDKIELVQTHASYVLLTGDYGYKLKKPVNFGFLDYSTLEKRKHFLEEELRLNKKIAPELYITVLPITQQGETFLLGEEGEPIEYVLKMRQFPQENLFTNLLEANKLSWQQIEELGKIVANFHLQAQTSDYISSFGTPEKIKRAFDDNYEQSKRYIGIVQTEEQLTATQAYTSKVFTEKQDLFYARIAQHKIRECHGDLHLKNICLWQNKIQLFDRIEFNETFRFVDVMYDIAFTIMDLEARGKQDFANAFLNTYLEQTGDWESLPLLPLYLSRQAYVRAKVNSFLLDDSAVSSLVKEKAATIACKYYQQAYQYTILRSGKITLMSGLSGSGKSTVAKEIAHSTGAIHIRSDAVRKHLAGISVEERGSEQIYTAEMNSKTYNRLLELGILLAQEGFQVILDAKYDRIAIRKDAIALAQKHNIQVEIVHCTAPIAVLRDRLNKRSGDISDAGASLLDSQLATTEDFTEEEKPLVTTINTSKNWLIANC